MPAESQLETDVFAEVVVVVVVEDAPVDAHVVMHLDAHDVPDLLVDDLLADHDVLDILVDNLDLDEIALVHLVDDDDLVVVDPLDLDPAHAVHVDVVDQLLADDLVAQDVSLLLVDLFLLQDDAIELFVVDLDVQNDLPLCWMLFLMMSLLLMSLFLFSLSRNMFLLLSL